MEENKSIHVTPQMIQAGWRVLSTYDHQDDPAEEFLTDVFCAMLLASPLFLREPYESDQS